MEIVLTLVVLNEWIFLTFYKKKACFSQFIYQYPIDDRVVENDCITHEFYYD